MTARELFSDMKEEKRDSLDFKRCVQFVRRYEEPLVTGKFEIAGNAVGNKFHAVLAGAPRKCPNVRKEFSDIFIDIRSSLKARLPKKIFLAKAESLYRDYCEWKREEGVEPEKLSFSNRWLKDWCKEYQISIKKPNKRFFITASTREKRITDFLKNIWMVRYSFTKLYGVDKSWCPTKCLCTEMSRQMKKLRRCTTDNISQGKSFSLQRANYRNDIISLWTPIFRTSAGIRF